MSLPGSLGCAGTCFKVFHGIRWGRKIEYANQELGSQVQILNGPATVTGSRGSPLVVRWKVSAQRPRSGSRETCLVKCRDPGGKVGTLVHAFCRACPVLILWDRAF